MKNIRARSLVALGILLAAAGNLRGEGLADPEAGRRKPGLLGAPLGFRSVSGVSVGLFLLQESYPENLPADAPTHLMTVVLREETTGEVVADAAVTIRVEGEEGEVQEVAARKSSRLYQGYSRLMELGIYRIEVSYRTEDRSGNAEFRYRLLPAPPRHVHGAEPEPIVIEEE